ncbi:SAF domain-containing protein [Streptomyces xiamenensis]|uniref:SAF domain-containing protein n=1 Tax=Streptomyces xiamenensis TaxID=408015 RepID=UPI0035E09357
MDVTTHSPAPAPAPPRGRATDLPISKPAAPAANRSWLWIAACAIAAILAGLGAVTVVAQVNDKEQVLAVARDVPVGTQLSSSDLRVVEVGTHPALSPIAGGRLDEFVGQWAAVDLQAGSLLSSGQVAATDVLSDGRQVVGIKAQRGPVPVEQLSAGDRVQVVFTAQSDPGDESGAPEYIGGTVMSVGEPDPSGAVVVYLAVEDGDGPAVAVGAASGDVALVIEPRA